MDRARGAPQGAPHTCDWHWARRGALLLGPLAALAALVLVLVLLREPAVTALVHYGLGGAYGAILGFALGGLLSLLKPARAERGAALRGARRAWVVHPHRMHASTGAPLR